MHMCLVLQTITNILANGVNRVAVENGEEGGSGKMAHTFNEMGNLRWGIGDLEWEAYMRVLDEAVGIHFLA